MSAKRRTRAHYAAWIGFFGVAILLTLVARYSPYFPGDVAVERWVQSLFSENLSWAERVSHTAEFPRLLVPIALVFFLSWLIAGWRAALLSLVSLAGMLALGKWLGPSIARPRPSADLVHVFRSLKGSSFPSLFALRYAATFGFLAVLALRRSSGTLQAGITASCSALVLLGWVARVAMGAHWPSDVIISYYLGILWAAFVIRLGLGSPHLPPP
jgi:membrane-associated phospholipid phosphatase